MKSLVIFGSIFICYAIGPCQAHGASSQAVKVPQKQLHNLKSSLPGGWTVDHGTIWAMANVTLVFIGFQFLAFATLVIFDLGLARNLFIRSGLSPPCFS